MKNKMKHYDIFKNIFILCNRIPFQIWRPLLSIQNEKKEYLILSRFMKNIL